MIHFWIFFWASRAHAGFPLFGCHFENEKGKFFSGEYNCDGLLSVTFEKYFPLY